ncbi:MULTISPECIES: hypothetical protein [unclassified Pseudomonas]|uniref:hypothetical protein n=1 Tax=unclassified Pseudomonas TaxID=196821 RepID=UPI002160FDF8|nr:MULTISPECIES: hypothetical protein [unclassified Pseudomonas]UVM48248.1 hypothetical protein LOY38_17765 [Pseudomonas sp. B21-015]WPN55924.1 hypothetical protein QMK51_17310 [Pseudomonas sp. P9_31]
MNNDVQGALKHTGSSLLTLNCIISGLTSQLKVGQGTPAINAAQAYALEVAKAYPAANGVAPDVKAITEFFNGHK